jgi:hypothetical protein
LWGLVVTRGNQMKDLEETREISRAITDGFAQLADAIILHGFITAVVPQKPSPPGSAKEPSAWPQKACDSARILDGVSDLRYKIAKNAKEGFDNGRA